MLLGLRPTRDLHGITISRRRVASSGRTQGVSESEPRLSNLETNQCTISLRSDPYFPKCGTEALFCFLCMKHHLESWTERAMVVFLQKRLHPTVTLKTMYCTWESNLQSSTLRAIIKCHGYHFHKEKPDLWWLLKGSITALRDFGAVLLFYIFQYLYIIYVLYVYVSMCIYIYICVCVYVVW